MYTVTPAWYVSGDYSMYNVHRADNGLWVLAVTFVEAEVVGVALEGAAAQGTWARRPRLCGALEEMVTVRDKEAAWWKFL